MLKRVGIAGLAGFFVAALACAQDPGQQVNVSAKIIEFQTVKGVDTGLSAYFKRSANKQDAIGTINVPSALPGGPTTHLARPAVPNNNAIASADITFPSGYDGGITVFFDRISINAGDIEAVLQALVSQNRAVILSQPRAMVAVGSAVPTVIKTTNSIPYSNTQVVGQTPVRVISFREVGVTLSVTSPQVIDDDGNPNTTDDTYIQLAINASFLQQGQKRPIQFVTSEETYWIYEFGSRSINTTVWLRHGQVLILGGLYKNKVDRKIASLPGLSRGEDMVLGAVERVIPARLPAHPLSSTLGNRHHNDERRELVFVIRADLWRYSYAMPEEFRFEDFEDFEDLDEDSILPSDLITDLAEEMAEDSEDTGAGGEQ